jgi:hypothetical protein
MRRIVDDHRSRCPRCRDTLEHHGNTASLAKLQKRWIAAIGEKCLAKADRTRTVPDKGNLGEVFGRR